MRIRHTLLPLTLIVLGCGARSALHEGSATTGADTSSTTSTGAGAGGSGGSPTCTLAPAGADVVLAPTMGFHERRPALVMLGGTDQAALVYGLDPVDTTGSADIPIDDVTLAAAGAWPPAVSVSHRVANNDGYSFVVGPRPGPTYSLFAVEAAYSTIFAADVDPLGGAPLQGPPVVTPTGTALCIANVADKHFTERVYGSEEANTSDVNRFDASGESGFVLGCSGVPIAGDAIPFEGVFLWAGSTAILDQKDCPKVPQPATKLLVGRFPLEGDVSADLATTTELPEPPSRIRLALRPAGAWLLWQGANAIHAQRLAADATPDLPDFVVELDAAPGFTATAFQGGVAVAWIAPAGIEVAVLDDEGNRVNEGTIPIAPGATVTGPLSMLASANALLIAWSQESDGQPALVHVTRLDGCSG